MADDAAPEPEPEAESGTPARLPEPDKAGYEAKVQSIKDDIDAKQGRMVSCALPAPSPRPGLRADRVGRAVLAWGRSKTSRTRSTPPAASATSRTRPRCAAAPICSTAQVSWLPVGEPGCGAAHLEAPALQSGPRGELQRVRKERQAKIDQKKGLREQMSSMKRIDLVRFAQPRVCLLRARRCRGCRREGQRLAAGPRRVWGAQLLGKDGLLPGWDGHLAKTALGLGQKRRLDVESSRLGADSARCVCAAFQERPPAHVRCDCGRAHCGPRAPPCH